MWSNVPLIYAVCKNKVLYAYCAIELSLISNKIKKEYHAILK